MCGAADEADRARQSLRHVGAIWSSTPASPTCAVEADRHASAPTDAMHTRRTGWAGAEWASAGIAWVSDGLFHTHGDYRRPTGERHSTRCDLLPPPGPRTGLQAPTGGNNRELSLTISRLKTSCLNGKQVGAMHSAAPAARVSTATWARTRGRRGGKASGRIRR